MSEATGASEALIQRYADFYRQAHRHPELSGQEHETTKLIEARLDELGIEHFRVSETGTVGVLRHGHGPVVAFRADIDGLPVTERTGLDYASSDRGTLDGEDVGVMHACGHDAHFSSALGAAEYLKEHPEQWSGTLVLIFQPAEETGSGAAEMIHGGLWDRVPRPGIVLGQHVMPVQAGTVALREGNAMTLADTVRITVRGRQSHGSQPEHSVDPIVAAASMILRLQTIVSRELAPGTRAVVTVSVVRAGAGVNVIPETAGFVLNVRTPDEEARARTMEAVHRIVDAEAQASRAEVEYETLNSFPRTYNDPGQAQRVHDLLAGALGEDHVTWLPDPLMPSEDVGTLADSLEVPLVYWFFGGFAPSAFADGAQPAPNHSPEFAPDADLALRTGIQAAIAVLLGYLGADASRS